MGNISWLIIVIRKWGIHVLVVLLDDLIWLIHTVLFAELWKRVAMCSLNLFSSFLLNSFKLPLQVYFYAFCCQHSMLLKNQSTESTAKQLASMLEMFCIKFSSYFLQKIALGVHSSFQYSQYIIYVGSSVTKHPVV